MFLAWYEKEADEKDNVIFQHRFQQFDGKGEHMAHFHNSVEMVFAVKGGFTTFINGERYEVNEGSVCFINSFEPHKYHYESGNEFFVVVISPEYFSLINGLSETEFPSVNPYNVGFDRIKEFLIISFANWDNSSTAFKHGFVDMLIGMMKRYYPYVPKKEPRGNFEVMVDAVKYINENSRRDITIDEVSAKFGYTPNYFSNLFNRFMEMSFRDYLNWCRMLNYTRLKQRQPELSTVKAAELCGFGSVKSFYRTQKKYGSIESIPDYLS
jgi:AraC-like DNA-binding protein